MYKSLLRPLIFRLTSHDAEIAHENALALLAAMSNASFLLKLLHRIQDRQYSSRQRTVFGVQFPNPVGLAAGFDKDGVALPALAALGFGFLEVGTITWHTQMGNPRPRMFRLENVEGLINRMGFNNRGAQALEQRLSKMCALNVPLGISLGKSARTPLESAVDDYCSSLRLLYAYGDFFSVNVSSPNTPGLRTLQGRDELDKLLASLQHEVHTLSEQQQVKPLLVKISPDLSQPAILEVLDVCLNHGIQGIIATNTTVSRDSLDEQYVPYAQEKGGLSGKPLTDTSLEVVRFIHRETEGQLPIIGVGGIASSDDALRMMDAGASLLQVYTGFVYEGPTLIHNINRSLRMAGM